jgi:hypothetical protein
MSGSCANTQKNKTLSVHPELFLTRGSPNELQLQKDEHLTV